jgi:hypothetical protein
LEFFFAEPAKDTFTISKFLGDDISLYFTLRKKFLESLDIYQINSK